MLDRRTFLLGTIPITLAFVAPLCDKRGGVKPSEQLTAARAFAIFPVALGAASEVIEVLEGDKDWTATQASKANRLLDGVLVKMDTAFSLITSGKFDVDTVRQLLTSILDTLEQGVKDGTLGVKNPTKQLYFSSLITAARSVITSIYTVADALQPLPKEMETARAQESLTAGGVAAIVSIIAAATVEIKITRDETNVKELQRRTKEKSEGVHAVLRSRF